MGIILPGSCVDLLAIIPSKEEASGKITKVALRNATLLAINVDNAGQLVLTLSVTPLDAERLNRIASTDGVTLTMDLSKRDADSRAPERDD